MKRQLGLAAAATLAIASGCATTSGSPQTVVTLGDGDDKREIPLATDGITGVLTTNACPVSQGGGTESVSLAAALARTVAAPVARFLFSSALNRLEESERNRSSVFRARTWDPVQLYPLTADEDGAARTFTEGMGCLVAFRYMPGAAAPEGFTPNARTRAAHDFVEFTDERVLGLDEPGQLTAYVEFALRVLPNSDAPQLMAYEPAYFYYGSSSANRPDGDKNIRVSLAVRPLGATDQALYSSVYVLGPHDAPVELEDDALRALYEPDFSAVFAPDDDARANGQYAHVFVQFEEIVGVNPLVQEFQNQLQEDRSDYQDRLINAFVGFVNDLSNENEEDDE